MPLPLTSHHLRHSARLTNFHGFELPLAFTSILEESKAVRESAGLFDISHMGHFIVTGQGARQAFNRLMTSDLEAVPFGKSLYGLLTNRNGGTIDDLIASAVRDDVVHVIVNAGNREEDFSWMRANLPEEINLVDLSVGQIALALQGPLSEKIVSLLEQGFERMKRREVRFLDQRADRLWISRTGYTGEDGWEFFGPEEIILQYYLRLSEVGPGSGMVQAGLGARDLLRLEMGYPLYGQELSPDRTAFDAGLDFAVNLRKQDFIGREKLLEKKVDPGRERLMGFVLIDRGIPRTHCEVIDPATSRKVGEVTSGGHSPRVGGGFGLAYLEASFAKKFEEGAEAGIVIHGKSHLATFHTRPFVKSGLIK